MSGRFKEISSTANPIIKEIRGLALKKNRDLNQSFMAEGLKLVSDAVEKGWNVKTLVFAKSLANEVDLKQRVDMLAAKVLANGGDILEVSNKVLSTITKRDNPQMVVGIVEQKWRSLAQVKPGRNGFWIALDRVRDPGNLGTIIRTADAVGADGVLLIGQVTDAFAIEAVRATMGSIFHVPLAHMEMQQFLEWRQNWPGIIVGTHLKGAVDHRSINYSDKPVMLLMGNEQQGLPNELAATCDHLALIAMDGAADSLNLAIATGIMAFEIRRHALKPGNANG
jgi:TrmH family RNA methyltransferase